jgi:hypothetical protein
MARKPFQELMTWSKDNPSFEILLKVPKSVTTTAQAIQYLQRNYHILVSRERDTFDYLYYGPDTRTLMGEYLDFGNGYIHMVIAAKYYVMAYPDRYRKLLDEAFIKSYTKKWVVASAIKRHPK